MAERLTASKNPVIAALVVAAVIALVAYRSWKRYEARRTSPSAPATARP